MAKLILRREPDLFDLDAWQSYLDELRGGEPDEYRDMMIEHAEGHIRAIGGTPQKSSAEAA